MNKTVTKAAARMPKAPHSLPGKNGSKTIPRQPPFPPVAQQPHESDPDVSQPSPSPHRIEVAWKDGETEVDQLAQLTFSPSLQHANAARAFLAPTMGPQQDELTPCLKAVAGKVAAVKNGDMREVEETLLAQAVTLNAVFIEMLRRSVVNMNTYLGPAETYMRLGLKAQAQCRATLETLAEVKNPRPVFTKHANFIAGNQQVNNTDGPQQVNYIPGGHSDTPRAGNNETSSNKLLEQ